MGNTHDTALLKNLTMGATMSIRINPPANVSLVGNVAGWIVEGPGINAAALFPFPNNRSTHFYDCTAGSKNIDPDLGSGPMIVDASNNVLSTGSIETNRTPFCRYDPL